MVAAAVGYNDYNIMGIVIYHSNGTNVATCGHHRSCLPGRYSPAARCSLLAPVTFVASTADV